VNTKALNALAGVICRAQEQDRTPMGIAFAVDSAGLHMSPETAAELERLRAQRENWKASFEAERKSRNEELGQHNEEFRAVRVAADGWKAQVAELNQLIESMRDALNGHECPPPGETPMEMVTRVAVRLMEAEAGRLPYAELAKRERVPARRQAWLTLARVEESERVAAALLSPEAARSAEKLTALLAPTQALREDEPAPKCRCDEPGADPYSCEADDCTGEFSELNPFGGGPVQGHDAKVSRTCTCGWRTTVWHVADGSAEEELHGHIVRVHGGTAPEASR
jgi:hypothetical protein